MCDCHSALDRRSLLRLGAGVVTVGALTTVEPATAAGKGKDKVIRKVFRGEFTDPATADWHYLPFKVPKGVNKIHVEYDYEPTDTGIGISYNVVDIGIFDGSGHGLGDAEGFRGWSGGARREFTIKTGRRGVRQLRSPEFEAAARPNLRYSFIWSMCLCLWRRR